MNLMPPVNWSESPSLSAAAGPDNAAYELKFLLGEAEARALEQWALGRLAYDPHADPALGHAYQITSLYCDTAQLDVYHRVGPYRSRKHRVRRYGSAPTLYLERKTRRGDRVRKQRTKIAEAELPWLANALEVGGPIHPAGAPDNTLPSPSNGSSTVLTWPGHWFHNQLARRRLAPIGTIAYQRTALVGQSEHGPMRLTFDRQLRGKLTDAWRVEPVEFGLPILTGSVVVEFKYRGCVPALFKEAIETMCLTPRSISKYRTLIEAAVLDAAPSGAGSATPRRPADA